LTFPDIAVCAFCIVLRRPANAGRRAAGSGPDETPNRRNPRRFRKFADLPGRDAASRRTVARTAQPTIGSRSAIGLDLKAAARSYRVAEQHVIRTGSPAAIESWRVVSPPTPAMRSGFNVGSASSMASIPGSMRAIGTGTGDQFDMTIEQERSATVLDRGARS